jgi:16S rRNA (cytosine967-C5)-methyltransferase
MRPECENNSFYGQNHVKPWRMKPAARIASAIDLMMRIEASPIPMDNTIREFMATRRFIGSKDRTAIVERVYRIMRSYARLGWWIEQAAVKRSATTLVLADLILQENPDDEFLAQTFNGDKYAADPLKDHEKTLIEFLRGKTIDDPAMPVGVRAECPQWAEEKLQALYGQDFETYLRAMIDPAPLDLRVNTLKSTVDEAIASLRADKVTTVKTPYSPVALRVEGKPFMSDSKAFRKGLVEIQDEGSQLIGLVTGAQPGMRVLDYCAGGGGKTLIMAAMMNNKGNIVAADTELRRLEKGRARYKKAGVHNVELRCLADESSRKWLRRQKETMDVVLIDAPCSSSGTWRRNPDLRWKWYGPSLDEICAIQKEILDRVAEKVKPGGRLVYATCSLLAQENEDQITAFLERHPDYAVLPLAQAWEGDKSSVPCSGPYLRMNPKDHTTDGFFAAILTKRT